MKIRRLKKYFLLFNFYVFLSAILAGCQSKPLYTETQVLMGTFVEVTSPDKKAAGIVFSEIARIDGLLSKYRPDSEISRLNRLGKLKVSPETFFIIHKSVEFWKLSQGAFDITVAPLVDLWGFTDQRYSLPSDEQIKNTLKSIGSDKIILHKDDNMVEFSVSRVKLDLGAIGKGFAIDCAAKKLKANNIQSCVINAGGQAYCLGDKLGKPWRIAVKNPRSENLIDYLELKDKSVSTSGDYQQYFIKDAKRYSHILDPRTGYPADKGIISVTVVASDGLTADALSTAIFVLGKEKGEMFAKKLGITETRITEEKNVPNNK